MSLNWDASSIKVGWDTLNEYDRDQVAHLAFVLMATGIKNITEDNVEELYIRIELFIALTRVTGWDYSLDELKGYIGYSTNVTSETRTQWTKRAVNRFAESRIRLANEAKQDA
jgi:hypothetical protein